MTAPSTSEELAPCPLCGSTVIGDWHTRDGRCVGCRACGCHVTAFNPDALIVARARWNTRTSIPAADVLGLAEEFEADARESATEGANVYSDGMEDAYADAAKRLREMAEKARS